MLYIKKKFDVLNREIMKDVCKSLEKELPHPDISKDLCKKYKSVSDRYVFINAAIHRLGFLSSMFILFNGVKKDVDFLIVFASGIVCMSVLYIFYSFAEYRERKSSFFPDLQ